MYVYTVYSQYSVCCRYTSCNLKQKQGSNCLLSIRRKWFLFIHIVPGNIVDFWDSDFLKKSQLDLPSEWYFFFTFFFAWIFFLAFSLAWVFFWFFLTPPPPLHHFSNGPSLTRNILGYSLFHLFMTGFCFSFRDSIESWNFSGKWSSCTNKYQEREKIWLVGVYWSLEKIFIQLIW